MSLVGFIIFLYMLNISYGNFGTDSGMTLIEQINGTMAAFKAKPIQIYKVPSDYLVKMSMYYWYVALITIGLLWSKKPKKTRTGVEQGSAAWNTDIKSFNKQYNEPFGKPTVDKKPGTTNMILSNDLYLSTDGRKTMRNNNKLIIGGSGTGKSRFYVKPNALQFNCSYVLTDPSGELLESLGTPLLENGYKIKVMNIIDMSQSLKYNPFNYVNKEADVLSMIDVFIENTNGENQKSGDKFWEDTERTLLQALAYYLYYECPPEDRTFLNIKRLVDLAKVSEEDPDQKSALDILFEDLEAKNPDHIACKFYHDFKIGAGKTLKSILITVKTRLAYFNIQDVANLTSEDQLELEKMGDEKTALFVIIPNAEKTYNFLVAMMYSQLFNTLYRVGEQNPSKRLNVEVHCLLDEFANIGRIPHFAELLATMRKYGISSSVILQSLSQLKTMYKDDWEGITDNCDSLIFLGGQGQGTLEYISKKLGNETIVGASTSRTYSRTGSNSLSYNTIKRELLTPDELAKMDNQKCIVFLRGVAPFFTRKYKYENHPNYKITGDNDPNKFFRLDEHPEVFSKDSKVSRKVSKEMSERDRIRRKAKMSKIVNEEGPRVNKRTVAAMDRWLVESFNLKGIEKIGFTNYEMLAESITVPDALDRFASVDTVPEGSVSKLSKIEEQGTIE